MRPDDRSGDGAPADGLGRILERHRRLAVVGLSPRPERPSHRVMAYMAAAGYEITPVNPTCAEVLGRRSVPSLAAAAAREPLEIVSVFRRSAEAPAVVDEAVALGAPVIWFALGTGAPEAAERAREAGTTVIEGRCIEIEHRLRHGG